MWDLELPPGRCVPHTFVVVVGQLVGPHCCPPVGHECCFVVVGLRNAVGGTSGTWEILEISVGALPPAEGHIGTVGLARQEVVGTFAAAVGTRVFSVAVDNGSDSGPEAVGLYRIWTWTLFGTPAAVVGLFSALRSRICKGNWYPQSLAQDIQVGRNPRIHR